MIREERRRLLLLWLISVGLSGMLSAGLAIGWHVRQKHRHADNRLPAADPVRRIADWMQSELALSGDQLTRLGQLQQECEAVLLRADARRREAEAAIAAALESADPAGHEHIGSALQALGEAGAARQRAVIEHILAIRAILTPEQRERFLHWTRDNFLHP